MEMNVLTCPGCGATLDVDDGLDTFYCKYCGRRIIVSDMSDAALNARVQVRQMEHEEQMQLEQMRHQARMREQQYERERRKEEQKRKEEKRAGIVLGIVMLVWILFIAVGATSSKKKSDQEEAHLQTIVEEVMIDIENGNFDEATIKANTIHYTSNKSHDIEKKWDETRKALLKQIKEAEKEAKKESGGGFFNWFSQRNLYLNQRVGCFRSLPGINVEYLLVVLQADVIKNIIFQKETGTANQGNLGSEDMKNFVYIPLPPLEEQHRIVAKIEELLPLCDKLK